MFLQVVSLAGFLPGFLIQILSFLLPKNLVLRKLESYNMGILGCQPDFVGVYAPVFK